MTSGYDNLLRCANDPSFLKIVDCAVFAMRTSGDIRDGADIITECRYAVQAADAGTGIVVETQGSRAFQPAAMLITAQTGQMPSPSAQFVRSSTHYLLQIFEANADDSGLVDAGATSANWITQKGRMLRG